MFQIISTLTLEVPSFLEAMYNYTVNRGVILITAIHFMPREPFMSSAEGDASVHTTVTDAWLCHTPCLGVGWPGSVPFVSDRPGAFSWLYMCGGRLACWCLLIG